MPVLKPIPPTDLNNLDKSFRAPLDAADGGATPGRRGELGFPLYLAFVPSCIPGQIVPTEPPDGPGRAGRALTGRLSGLAAVKRVLVSYRPLARNY